MRKSARYIFVTAILLAVAYGAGSTRALLGPRGALGPFATVQDALNTVGGTVTGTLCSAVGGTQAESAVCTLDALHLRYATRFKRANGTIVTRSYGALVAVPTLLDADANGVADVIATVLPTSTSSVTLSIVRIGGAALAFPASVEAIVADPTGALPRDHINYGADGLDGTLPQSFTGTIGFAGERLTVTNTVAGGSGKLGLLAGLFDGTPEQRQNVTGGTLRYSPVPPRSGATLELGDRISGTLTSSIPTTLDLAIRHEGKAVSAHVKQLPSTMTLGYERRGVDRRVIDFSASARIASLGGTFTEGDDRAELELTDMPRSLLITQDSKRKASVSTKGSGRIGQVRFGLAAGDAPRYLPGSGAYVRIDEDATTRSLTAQINGLTDASLDAEDTVNLDAAFSGVATNPVRVLLDDRRRRLDARVNDAPDHITVGVDLDAGTVHYDGHGQPVGAIDVDATDVTPFFGRATRVTGAIRNLPPQVDISLWSATAGVGLSSTAAIGTIEVAAGNGATELPPGADAGVLYRDTKTSYRVGARVKGLRSVSFSKGPSTYALRTQTAGGPFTLTYEDDAGQKLTGRIADLPSTVDVGFDGIKGSAIYAGSSTIGELTADLSSPTPFFEGATKLHARILGFPSGAEVRFRPNGDTFAFTASKAIGLIEFSAGNGNLELPDAGEAGLVMRNEKALYSVGARIKGLSAVTFTSTPTYKLDATLAAGPFRIVYAKGKQLTARIADLPSRIVLDVDPAGRIAYTGSASIASLTAEIVGAAPFLGRADRLGATIQQFPAGAELLFRPTAGGVSFTTSQPIGLIAMQASNRADTPVKLPGPAAGIYFEDTQSKYIVAARVLGLRKAGLTVNPAGRYDAVLEMAPGDFTVFYSSGGKMLTGTFKGLPGRLTATIDPAAGTYHYVAPAPITEIAVQVSGSEFAGPFTNASVRLLGVPGDVTVTTRPDTDADLKVTIVPSVDTIEASISTDGELPVVSGINPGATLFAKSPVLRAALKVKDLQEITYRAEPLSIGVRTATAQPFGVRLEHDDPADSFPAPTVIAGSIQNMPASFNVTMDEGVVRYRAPSRIGMILLNLEYVKIGDKRVSGHVHVFGVPTKLDLWTGGTDGRVGVDVPYTFNPKDPRESIDVIDVHLASLERYPDLPRTDGNAISFDVDEHNFELRTHVEQVQRALIKEQIDGSRVAMVEFTSAAPLKLEILKGLEFEADVQLLNVPKWVTASIGGGQDANLRLDSSAEIEHAHLELRKGPKAVTESPSDRKFLFTGDIYNIPTYVRLCAGGEFSSCPHSLPGSFVVDSKFRLFFDSNGPEVTDPNSIRIDGRLCLNGGFAQVREWTPENCRDDATASKYLDLENVRLRGLYLDSASGQLLDNTYDDEDLVAFKADVVDLLFDAIEFVRGSSMGVRLRAPVDPIRFDDFLLVLDTSGFPSVPGLEDIQGSVVCPSTTELYFLERQSDGGLATVRARGSGPDYSEIMGRGC